MPMCALNLSTGESSKWRPSARITLNRLPLHELLAAAFGKLWQVRDGLPIAGPVGQLPQPDFSIIPRRPRIPLGAKRGHPKDSILVVEVSDSTLSYDRRVKAPLYASMGVPEYWIVDIKGRAVEVYRDPAPDVEDSSMGWRYQTTFRLTDGHDAEPAVVSGVRIAVSEILGPRPS